MKVMMKVMMKERMKVMMCGDVGCGEDGGMVERYAV